MKSFLVGKNVYNGILSLDEKTETLIIGEDQDIDSSTSIFLSIQNDSSLGIIHSYKKVYFFVELEKKLDRYALKNINNGQYFSNPPLKDGQSAPFIANRSMVKDWELFDLMEISLNTESLGFDLKNSLNTAPSRRANKHIVVAIRYSVLLENLIVWQTQRQDITAYKATLFEDRRLQARYRIFTKITLPSLKYIYDNKSDDVAFSVYILSSTELPQKHKDLLDDLVKTHPFLVIKYLDPTIATLNTYFDEYSSKFMEIGDIYASARLDDDDALSLDWYKKIVGYLTPQNVNKVISLSGGMAIEVDEHSSIKKASRYTWLFSSAGLAYIGKKSNTDNRDIYSCGGHMTPHARFETILYSKGFYFLRSFNEFNDSQVGFKFPTEMAVEERDKWLVNYGITP